MNERFILSVFNKMTEHRPAFQKYLVTDEEDDEVDHRILGDLLIKNFPWPIGVELRRLFSGSLQKLDRGRLDQIFKTIERSMQFISYLLLSQLWEEKRNHNFELSKGFYNEFPRRITVTTLGNFAWLIRNVSELLKSNDRPHFISEMNEAFGPKFFELLDFWAPERNDIGHYQINLPQEEIEKRCVEYEDKLCLILQQMAFLCKYKLVTMRQIVVNKHKHRDAQFNHHVDLLNSSDSDFKTQEMQFESYADSNSVLLMKDFKIPKEYINLSPFVIDTRPEIIDQKEKFGIKKDVFLFSKFHNDKLYYVGTEVTEKVDLSTLSFYPELVLQFKEILEDLSPTKVEA